MCETSCINRDIVDYNLNDNVDDNVKYVKKKRFILKEIIISYI